MEFLNSLRAFLEPKLLLEQFPNWGIGYAATGFLIGLVTAFILWYRSARRIQALQDENANLSKGDINVRDTDRDIVVEEEKIAARTHQVIEREDREITPGIATTIAAATGAGVGAAATMLRSEEQKKVNVDSHIETTAAPKIEATEDYRLSTAFDEEPADTDDLTLLEGIDETRAAELREAGIYKFSQLENLSEEDRRKFGFKFGWPDINWGSWGATAAAAGVGSAALVNRSQQSVKLENVVVEEKDFQLTTTFDEEPAVIDDLTQIDGIDHETAVKMRSAGIYKYSQLEELDDDERERLSRKFNFTDLNRGKWGTLGALGAGGLAAGLLNEGDDEQESTFDVTDDGENEAESDFQLRTVYEHEPEDAEDLTLLQGIDADKAAELHSAGIYKVSQIEELDEGQKAEFDKKFKIPDINWGDGFGHLSGEVEKEEPDLNLETAFNELPNDVDDLTLLEGIDEEKASALHEAGIYKYSQLEELDEEKREELGKQFNWPDLDWGKWGAIGTLGTLAGASLLKEGNQEEVENNDEQSGELSLSTETQKVHLPEIGGVKPDWTWGYTFIEKPAKADDLAKLDGITEEDAARLNAEGVYTIKQLEDLPEHKRDEVKSRFGWGDIDWAKWGGAGAVGSVTAVAAAAITNDENDNSTSETIELPDTVKDRQDVETDWTWGYKFTDKPEDADDLTQMEGVSAEDAEELNRQGVYTFNQLENLPEEKQAEVKAKFGWDSIDWGKWGTLTTIGAAATAAVTLSDDDDEKTEVETTPANADTGNSSVDVSSVWESESEKIAKQTEAIDTSEKYGELSLSPEDFANPISEEFNGETIDIHPRYGITYPKRPDQIDDLTQVRGIGLATEKQLNKNGIYRFKQIANWNAGAIEGISTDLDLGTRIRDDEWVSQARAFVGDESEVADEQASDRTDYRALISQKFSEQNVEFKPGLGVLYTEAPSDPDDLTEINGIGESLQTKLNDYGVYKFTQLANWNETNISAFNERLAFSGRIERDEWVPQAENFAQRIEEESNYLPATGKIDLPDMKTYDGAVDKFTGHDVEVDQRIGVVYNNRPDQADDLKRIWGIGNRIEQELNDNGIYKFSQIAHWNDYNIREFDDRLSLKGRIERDEWISQATSLAEENEELHRRYSSVILSDFRGESVTVKPGYGVVYTQTPSAIDDLTEINGVGPITEKQLNDIGIYRFKQIASFDDEAVEAIEEIIDGKGRITRNQWVIQAKEFLAINTTGANEPEPGRPKNMEYIDTLGSFDGEDVDIDENFGIIYTGRPTEQDDLKRIRGVGKYIEKELNDRGVYRFKQIASWNPYNIWAFGKDLAFPGRITRENWVGQSIELAELEEYRIEAEKTAKTKFDGKGVKVDPELGLVYRKKPDVSDDLTQLEGIDEDTAARLNSDGIYTIDQVNSLKGPQQKSFASRFGLGGIDWAKWSGISAIGAISAAGTNAIAAEKDIGNDAVATVENISERTADAVAPITEAELPAEEPKGIFGTGDDGDLGDDITEDGAIIHTSANRRVAFIMDVSRSLTPAQLRLSKTELSAAVSSLPEGSLYQVIFFSGPTWFAHQRMIEGGARGEDVVISDGDEQIKWNSGFGGFEYEQGNDKLPGAPWRETTPENIAATLEDIEAVGKSYGTTWHLPLTMALNLEPVPKNIYFLTDGETARQDQVAQEMIEMANVRGGITKINTIALMVPGASVPLHQMAKGTGGEYSLVIAGGKLLKDDDLREYLAEKNISLND